jgi:ceramide glucosyltransferase
VPRPERFPSVTVIRPIKGLDVDGEANVRAALETGYPGELETLFVFDDASEPAVAIVRRVISEAQRHGRRVDARILFCGAPPPGTTGKLNAMIDGLSEARGELVAFADSDIRPSPTALTTLVQTLLSSSDAGSAFAPVVVTEPTRTVGDAGYALMLNGLYSPVASYVARRRADSLPFIMGQFMLFRREALVAIGGLESARGQLVDDMYLGKLIEEAGYRNSMSPEPVPIIQHDLPLREFIGVYRRWMTFSRTGLPGLRFKSYSWARGGAFWLGVIGAVLLGWTGQWGAALLAAVVSISLVASVNALHARAGGHPLPLAHLWVAAALIIAAPFALLVMHTQRQIEWRGRRYALSASGRLDTTGESRSALQPR